MLSVWKSEWAKVWKERGPPESSTATWRRWKEPQKLGKQLENLSKSV